LKEFLSHISCIEYVVFRNEFLETYYLVVFASFTIAALEENIEASTQPIEISFGKTLYVGTNLSTEQRQQVIDMIQKHFGLSALDYLDMKGIHPNTCIHHIYTNEEVKNLRQPQRRKNSSLKEIVKYEFQKLLSANLIYPISNSKWISPLVVVCKKNGKWRISLIIGSRTKPL